MGNSNTIKILHKDNLALSEVHTDFPLYLFYFILFILSMKRKTKVIIFFSLRK